VHRLPTAVIAGAALVVGFGAARATGVAAAGAVVVLAAVAWCLAREVRRTAWWRLAVVVAAGAGCFLLSHALAGALTPWGAVAAAAVALGLVTWLLVDRPGRPPAQPGARRKDAPTAR
jgi:hypothetical protein